MIQYVYPRLYVAGEDDAGAVRQWDGAVLYLEPADDAQPHRLALDVSPDEPLEPDAIRQGADFIQAQIAAGREVVVVAPYGTMFAAVFPLAYLVAHHDKTLPDAWMLISNHQAIWPPPYFWLLSLVETYELPFSEDEIFDDYLPMQMALATTRSLHMILDGVYLGSLFALLNAPDTLAQGIQAVLRVDNTPRDQGQWPRAVRLLDLPIPDARDIAPDTLDQGADFIAEQVRAGRKVLVHCHEGVSRSVTMVLAYLIAHRGLTLAQAYRRIVFNRPVAHPHPSLLWSLVRRYDLPYSYAEVFHPLFLRALERSAVSSGG